MRFVMVVLAVCMMFGSRTVAAQGAPAPAESRGAVESGPAVAATAASAAVNGGVPIGQIIAAVAKKSGKRFLADPRVRADVTLFGQNPSDVTYSELLAILDLHGFAAVEAGGYVQLVPNALIRAEPLPVITGKENLPDDEYVTATIHVKSASAPMLVPIMRPLLPQQAHLAADVCTNTLMIVDRFANYKRIEALVRSLDVGNPRANPERCEPPPAPPREMPAPR
jgi:type II secretory pathway component GspD/PulD (secretin)